MRTQNSELFSRTSDEAEGKNILSEHVKEPIQLVLWEAWAIKGEIGQLQGRTGHRSW